MSPRAAAPTALAIMCSVATTSVGVAGGVQEDLPALRIIIVDTEVAAVEVQQGLAEGLSFEWLAREYSQDGSAAAGGYLGAVVVGDLRREFQEALRGLAPGEVSAVTPLGTQLLLLQLLSEQERSWIRHNEAGFSAFSEGRYPEALESLSAAVEVAERMEPDRLAQSLSNLAVVYRQEERYVEAEELFDRALEIYEAALDPNHPDLALTLSNKALLLEAQEDFRGAEALHDRALAIFERTLGPDHPNSIASRAALAETLAEEANQRFAEVVRLAFFPDEEYRAAREAFERALTRAPVTEASYLRMAEVFLREDMVSEREWILEQAAERFESREAYYRLGEMHMRDGALNRAFEEFQRASQTPGPPGMDTTLDTEQRALILIRMAELDAMRTRFDEAIATYNRAFETDPSIVESRLGLGDVYSRLGQTEDALEEYRWVVTADPGHVTALSRMAEALLNLGRYPEAAQVAEAVLELDPDQLSPRFYRARALIVMGQTEEGEALMEEYRALDEDRQAEEQLLRDIYALHSNAMDRLIEGEHDEGIRLYREAIRQHPDTPEFYLRLGLVQNRLGLHLDAVETFLTLIERELRDDFIVHQNLAAAYAMLGDVEASDRHEAIYLEKLDAAAAN